MRTPWIVLEGQKFKCKVCGETYSPTIPCSLGMISVMMRQFVRDHKKCKKIKEKK